MTLGGFAFVLHTHMPFYRGASGWPHGEETLHEVMAECYVPLLEALTDLHEGGLPVKLTLGITPVLAEQLADPLVISHFEEYLRRKIDAATDEVKYFQNSGEAGFLYLAHFYLDSYRRVLKAFLGRFNRDIIAGFRALQDAGVLEILTSAATHAYLPLMSRDSTIHAQLAIGKRATERHFGKSPTAIWLPECAYRPAYEANEGGRDYQRPGIEQWVERAGMGLFFGESEAIDGGLAANPGGTFEPYLVKASRVAVMGRNRVVGEQVWSPTRGFPGDPYYREFYRKDPRYGFQYWRVTDRQTDIAYKEPYDPFKAGQRVQKHAEHFTWLAEDQLRRYTANHHDSSGGTSGLVVAAYNTELFGHWWFEGVVWLKQVLERMATSQTVELCTASGWLEQYPATKALELPESSWQHGASHVTWINPETGWMWEDVFTAERRMEVLVERFPQSSGEAEEALNQAAREVLLLESSDWEFLYITGQARQYANERFSEHVDRFSRLAAALESGDDLAALELARRYNERDNLFPDIDYRAFAPLQG